MNRFKKNIKYLRKQKKLTQIELSEELGVKRTSVINWENGYSYPGMETLFKVKEYFDVTLDDLLLGIIGANTKATKQLQNIKSDETHIGDDSKSINALIENNTRLSIALEENAITMKNYVKSMEKVNKFLLEKNK